MATNTCHACQTRRFNRNTDHGRLDLCQICFDEAGLENEHSDYGHDVPVKGCPSCGLEADVKVATPARKTYAKGVYADGPKTHKAAARMFAKVGQVSKVAAHFGCSSTAARRWIRQGEALLAK